MLEDLNPRPHRPQCLDCLRPKVVCICPYLRPLTSRAKFVILMHPMELKKVKNTSGRMTYLSLPHSELIYGIDFTNHPRVNQLIEENPHGSMILYPDDQSHNLSLRPLDHPREEPLTLFLLDGTWPCAKKMMHSSQNLKKLPSLSFDVTTPSGYVFKKQPHRYCLSIMEAVQQVLKLFTSHGREDFTSLELDQFLLPFRKMIEWQMDHYSK